MQRFKRIAHRGWLRRAITIATFGYYPRTDGEETVIADWCISHSRLYEWLLGQHCVDHGWEINDTAQRAWSVTDAVQQAWSLAHDGQCTWSITSYTVECQ